MLQPVEAVLFLFRSRDAVCRLLTATRQVCQLITVSLVTVLFLSVGCKGYGIGSAEMNFSDFFSVGINDSICRKILESSVPFKVFTASEIFICTFHGISVSACADGDNGIICTGQVSVFTGNVARDIFFRTGSDTCNQPVGGINLS